MSDCMKLRGRDIVYRAVFQCTHAIWVMHSYRISPSVRGQNIIDYMLTGMSMVHVYNDNGQG